ncbi:MAG: SGNH/GDSL hydrolase family protein [Myxococcota bacterium]
MRRLRALLQTTLLALGAVLVVLLGLEVVLRVAGGPTEATHGLHAFHQSDPVLGWIGRPNLRQRFASRDFDVLVEHGPDGFRLAEPPASASATRHVLVLGDSFVWGWGVGQGEIFTDHIQRALAPDVAITNRGLNAIGTSQEYLILGRELEARKYDRVLLMFTPNDVKDNADPKEGRRPWFELEGDRLIARNTEPKPLMSWRRRMLKHHSHAYSFLSFRWGLLKKQMKKRKPLAERQRDAKDLRELRGWEVTIQLLRTIDALAREHGASLHLVYAHPGNPLAHERVVELCERSGVALVDLTPTLAAQPDLALNFTYDPHWTPQGHRAVAEALLASPTFDAVGVAGTARR